MSQEIRTTDAHTHVPRLIQTEHVMASIHGAGVVGRFNTWLALQITGKVGSMWAAYLFALLALISLPAAIASGNTIVIVAWLAQTFLQLVLLPIIIVGQNVQQAANDARAQADHETLCAVHDLTKHIDVLQDQQIQILEVIGKPVHCGALGCPNPEKVSGPELQATPLIDARGNLVGARVRRVGTDEAWDFGNDGGHGHPDWRTP